MEHTWVVTLRRRNERLQTRILLRTETIIIVPFSDAFCNRQNRNITTKFSPPFEALCTNFEFREVKMKIRTDLAVESTAKVGLSERGIRKISRGNTFRITEIIIDNDSHINTIGKGMGRYITLEGHSLSFFSDDYEDMVLELSHELKSLIPDGEIIVVGLGNNDITPDALGPRTAARVLATRHLRDELAHEEEDILTSLRRVSVFAGGVLGQTGIETAEMVHALCKELNPCAIIAVDALACSDISRLGTTIQLSDTGISPGSGVSNARKELSRKLFGIPVIAVGVPTVVDMHTIVRNFTDAPLDDDIPNMMVTPRDIDRLTERASQLIAYGINLALHPKLTLDDVRGLF
jgi:spore protease